MINNFALLTGLSLLATAAIAAQGAAQTSAAAITSADRLSYPDVVDLFLDAPLVLTTRVARVSEVSRASGNVRLYLEGDVVRLIRAPGTLATRVAWLVDVPLDARGRVPRLKGQTTVLAGLPVAGRPGVVRLAARDAMQPWSASFEARVRAIVAAGLATDAPPRVTGVTSAFHVAGNLPGEGETQIFLAARAPVSLTVLSRPGQPRRWAVAFGEIVDEAAAPPARDTLGWYRLACALPPELPAAAVAELAPADAAAARDDYRFVVGSLGRCTRTRGS